MRVYTGTVTHLEPTQIFVFGSNTQGRHGKGAALTARMKFGAIYGKASGPQGQSYAIITKDLTSISQPSRSVEQITDEIRRLYEYAKTKPRTDFLIAYNTRHKPLNGYDINELAAMFASIDVPDNIVFEVTFAELVVKHQLKFR